MGLEAEGAVAAGLRAGESNEFAPAAKITTRHTKQKVRGVTGLQNVPSLGRTPLYAIIRLGVMELRR